jgi:AcrR family transcriptional regulator
MPRLIDHADREREVAEAAWRVAVRDGVRGLSVRNVAAEAGLATGSLRRAFPTQHALIGYCLDLVSERVRARMLALPYQPRLRDLVELHLQQVLPLDQQRRTEMEVFVVIGAAALSDPDLRPVYDRANDDLAAACCGYVQGLVDAGEAPAGTDVPLAAASLHALVDGLALHLIRQPPDASTSWATRALGAHLDALASAAA